MEIKASSQTVRLRFFVPSAVLKTTVDYTYKKSAL